MKNTTRLIGLVASLILLVIIAVFSLPTPPIALALPSADPCLSYPNNLIVNCAMSASNSPAELADHWQKFILTTSPYGEPNFEHVDNEPNDGSGSQHIWSDYRPYGVGPFDAGIYQTVTGLTPGQYYHFWVGLALAAYDYEGSGNQRSNWIGRQVGVDPTGGTDPKSSTVIWGSVFYNGVAAMNRPELNRTFLAQTSSATIYLRAINTSDYGRAKVWFDSVYMERWNPQPTPTFTPTATPSPTVPVPPPSVVQNPLYLPMVSNYLCFIPTTITFDVGKHPKGIAVDATTNRVAVSLFDESAITIIDANTNTAMATWWTGDWGGGNGIGMTNGRTVASLRNSNAVALVNATTGLPLTTKAVGSSPYGIAASNGNAWIANFGSGSASVMNTASTAITTTNIGGTPSLVAAAGNRGFVSYGTGVAELANTGALMRNFPGGAQTFGVAFDASNNRLFVADRANSQLKVLDANTGTMLNSTTLPRVPYAMTYEPSQGLLYIVSANNNQVDVLNASTLVPFGSVAIGTQGTNGGDSIGTMNGRVYVANYEASTLTMIQNTCGR